MQNQRTPLYEAAAKGHVEVVQVLVQAGANLDQTTQVRGAQLTTYASLPCPSHSSLLVLFSSCCAVPLDTPPYGGKE